MRVAILAALVACSSAPSRAAYPPAHRGAPADDPYRWLEAMDSADTRAWVGAENHATDAYFATVPRDVLHARLAELFKRDQTFLPQRRGKHVLWMRQGVTQDQPILVVADTLDGAERVVLDPNALSPDGKEAFAGYAASEDGARIVYGMAAGGGDWTRWRIRDVATGTDLPDELANAKYYTPRFTRDGTGLYYSRFPAPPAGKELTETDHDCKLYFHRVGTPVAEDTVVYQRTEPTTQFDPLVTRDGNYLVITIGEGQVGDTSLEQIAILDLTHPGAKPVVVVDTYANDYVFVGNLDDTFFFRTNAGAANFRIVSTTLAQPTRWREIVPETTSTIDGASVVGRKLLVTYLHDVHAEVVMFDRDGKKLREIALPGLGSAWGFAGGPDDHDTFYWFTSFTTPGTVYRYDLETNGTAPWHAPALPFEPKDFETKQVFFASKDGTKVPMFVTMKKGLALDGARPTIMTGYGFGGVTNTPVFIAQNIPWLEHGGVTVLVNVRGGGEYGEAWHLAAKRMKRQTELDDFIAAGEYLIANKYTSPAHLGAIGYSGGGFLVGAVLVQRPDLFGAVVPAAGLLDMLRFHLFGQGAGWQEDLGHPDDPAERALLRSVSPLHNVKPGTRYPAVLVTTSDHDVRVAPLHSYKLTAALQAAQAGPAPILLRVQTDSGHGGGSLVSQEVEQNTEIYAFFARELGLQWLTAASASLR